MALSSGTHLGPYEIQAPIGVGGMGEVYKARDTRLNRDVAIKVLPAAFADDADRRERFQREAQAIAALSHPNILAIFDFGIEGAMAYAVTELLQGETLRGRLGAGPLPVRKIIDFAGQIARGLAAAHDRGLVHRDLKPENIFLCDDGHVKILDFGLARIQGAATGATETVAALTDPGTVMGTAGYMAPEQVRGLATDARTDVFAFGAVLYEMLSGQRAFKGDTAADSMTAILREDPPELTGSRPDLPPAFDRIVRHCLEKHPNERFQAARDVAFALEALSGSASQISAKLDTIPRSRSWLRAAALAALLLAAVGAGMALQMSRAPAGSSVHYQVKTFDRQMIGNARFMPDGQTIVFSAAKEGTAPELFILHPNSVSPQLLAGAGTHLLSVSSKNELAVLTGATAIGHRLYKGTLGRLSPGGAARAWLEGVREADWSPDGTTLAIIRDAGDNVDKLEYPIGTQLHEVRGYLSDVRVSHDGRRIAFIEHKYRYDDRGVVKIIDQNKAVTASTGEFWGVEGLTWTPDDTSVVFSGSDLSESGLSGIAYHPYAVRAEGGRSASPVLATMASVFMHDIDANGRWLIAREEFTNSVIVRKPGETVDVDVSWLDLAVGRALSPNGDLAVFTDENAAAGQSYAVMLRKTDGAPPVRLGDGNALRHGLSPDRKWVVAYLLTTDQHVIYPTGAGEPRRLDLPPNQFKFSSWFPDSSHVLLCGGPSGQPRRCYKQSIAGGPMQPVGSMPAIDGTVAPDGTIVTAESQTKAWIHRPAGGPPTLFELPADASGEEFVGWSTESEPFFARDQPDQSVQILLRPPGKPAVPVGTISTSVRSGLMDISVSQVVGDAQRFGYVADYTRQLSTLLVASGIK